MKKGQSMQTLRKNSYRKPTEIGQLVRLQGQLDEEVWARVEGRPFDRENPKMEGIDYLNGRRFFFHKTDLFVLLDRFKVNEKDFALLLSPEGEKVLVYACRVDNTPILPV